MHEAEMVAAFLAGEMGSSRFGARLRELVVAHGLDRALVTDPDTTDQDANERRRLVLGVFRGRPDRDLFEGFPADTARFRSTSSPEVILSSRSVDYSYWVVHGIARDLERGGHPGALILVGADLSGPFTVVEGHARATALGLVSAVDRPRTVPDLLGVSAGMGAWTR